ncbi:hypothetical protein Vi05172_g12886 [Venturia inaequalis]|nr:hypothetical protein Vi05172_g12886 [Venturia inaequalis]
MSETSSPPLPERYGIILFPGFQALDVFGPLDSLNMLGRERTISLSIIAATLDPVSTRPPNVNDTRSPLFAERVVPTHTFENAPGDLEVLIVPGGQGTRSSENMIPIHAFLRKTVLTLRYLLTVCTGSAVVAQTGLLDQRRATTNKKAWGWVVKQGINVRWVGKARWVVDDPSASSSSAETTGTAGNPSETSVGKGGVAETAKHIPIWSSSGVAAGMDMIFAFIKQVYGKESADGLANILEYERHEDASWDPFAKIWGVGGS